MRLHATVGNHGALQVEVHLQIQTELSKVVIGHVRQRIQIAHLGRKCLSAKSAVLSKTTEHVFAQVSWPHRTAVDPRVRCKAVKLNLGEWSEASFGDAAFAFKHLVAVMPEPEKLA